MDLKEQELLGDKVADHWYYRTKLAALEQATKDIPTDRVIDVGAGSGFFSRCVLETGRSSVATCVDPGYDADREEVVAGKLLEFRRQLPAIREEADLVLLMDVLEHVEDDVALLSEYVDKARPGTRFILTVPAFQWMWSGHDVFLEHYRRYTLPQLEQCARRAGLEIEVGCYLYGALLPVAALARISKRLVKLLRGGEEPAKSDMRAFSPAINAAFWGVCRAELPWFMRNRVAGLTVFARCRKP